MDTFIGRVQHGFGKFSTVAALGSVVVAILGLSQLWYDGAFGLHSSVGSIQPSMRWQNSWRYGSINNTPKENARFTFDLNADLTPLFNWNTKQVFVYVTVDYNTTSKQTGTQNSNSVVIWDKILQDKNSAKLDLKSVKSKYSVWDLQTAFGGDSRELQMNLRWNVQPHVGFLINGVTEIEGGDVTLPPLPAKKQK